MIGVFRWRGALAVVAVAALVLAGAAAVAHLWDRLWAWAPWSHEQRLERARDALAEAEDTILTLEAERRRLIAIQRQDQQAQARVAVVQRATDPVVKQARQAPDAQTSMDADRAVRLRDHDRRLCGLEPALCDRPAEADAAAGAGDPALSSVHPAGEPDLG